MSSGDTKALIGKAIDQVWRDVPSLRQLNLVVRLELPARHDEAVWRVKLPEKEIARDPGGDARLNVTVPRAFFNALAGDPKAGIRDWVEAYEHGQVKVSGEPAVVKLLGNVIGRQLARSRYPRTAAGPQKNPRSGRNGTCHGAFTEARLARAQPAAARNARPRHRRARAR